MNNGRKMRIMEIGVTNDAGYIKRKQSRKELKEWLY